MPAAEDTTVVLTEASEVWYRRYEEARLYGFCDVDARLWADSSVDSGELRRLKRAACPPRTAARILL